MLLWPNGQVLGTTRVMSFYDQIPFLCPSYKCPSSSLSTSTDTHHLRSGLLLTCLSLSYISADTQPPKPSLFLDLLALSCACQEGPPKDPGGCPISYLESPVDTVPFAQVDVALLDLIQSSHPPKLGPSLKRMSRALCPDFSQDILSQVQSTHTSLEI